MAIGTFKEMGAAMGEQVGRAVGTAVAGPAGGAVGAAVGKKAGEQAGAQMDQKSSSGNSQNKDSTSKLLNDSDQTISRMLGNVTDVRAAKNQNSGQASFFSKGAKDEDLQKNQDALQNASCKIQDLKEEHGQEAKSSNSYSYSPTTVAA